MYKDLKSYVEFLLYWSEYNLVYKYVDSLLLETEDGPMRDIIPNGTVETLSVILLSILISVMVCIWFSRHFLSGGHLETGGGSMGNRRYTLEQKIRFLDTYEKMGSVAGAA